APPHHRAGSAYRCTDCASGSRDRDTAHPRVCMPRPSRVPASWPCTPPLGLLPSILTVPWNGAYAICTRWSSILLRNRCDWRTRGECLWGMHQRIPYLWDRLRPQLIELTIFALTLLGPSGEVATNLSWASATRAAHKDSSLCAYPRERRGNSSTSASDRGDPGSHDDGGPDAFAPHC